MIEKAPDLPHLSQSYCVPNLKSDLASRLRHHYLSGVLDAHRYVVMLYELALDVSRDEGRLAHALVDPELPWKPTTIILKFNISGTYIHYNGHASSPP